MVDHFLNWSSVATSESEARDPDLEKIYNSLHDGQERFPPEAKALVAPITKDVSTSLYTVALNTDKQFVLDLAGPLLWFPCPPKHPTVPCNSTACATAGAFHPPGCPRIAAINKQPCTCTAYPVNPVTGMCSSDDLTFTSVTLSSTDGKNPTTAVYVPKVFSSCAPKGLLSSLPAAAVGVAGLARSGLAVPSQLFSKLYLKKQFAICLPSSGAAPGAAFFGTEPFYFLAAPPVDVTARLTYTTLLSNPRNPAYHLEVKGLAVNREAVPFLSRMLEFDSLGHGGVMISTASPYTTLTSHIYRPFLKAFAAATKAIPRAPKVKPFGLCLNSTALGSTRVGYGVPQIDVMLAGGRNWTIFGANSLKQVDKDTACLAFVDGGPKAEQAMVIGGYQLENSFLLFDLARSRLGFLSTLLGIMTTCSNFNFTVKA
ncbi:hypothetical protein C4D60_Mb08t22330 [Musa balbisiana]|uniref:Peptidase A1 domain-containing protein n=1 Tax=Musa balbisiana TaxID=52838 RepID=A0A4S8K5P9_MUSBA|nr:hypothetical protein C4D60_Mb08t22330 [Musa balbisiana]